jgi:cobalt/nickel transport protein
MRTQAPSKPRMSTRTFAIYALLVCIALAGVVSYYASSHPDGLNKVAIDKGLAKNEKQSATADSPLAGYSTKDVGNERLSGGLAGVIGVTSVLLIAGGVAYVVRRRTPADESDG